MIKGNTIFGRGRPAVKREAVRRELVRRIVAGTWSPGSRVPTHAELAREFGTGTPTVCAVVEGLCADGFLEARRRQGLYVSAQPPHLCTCALVFPGHPAGRWSRFWDALDQAAVALERAPRPDGVRFQRFYGIDGHLDAPDYAPLLARVQARALAGVVYANAPFELAATPLLAVEGMPQVALASAWDPQLPQIMVRYPDLPAFTERAVAHLVSPAGGRRRRLAALSYGLDALTVERWLQAVRRHGAESASWLVQAPDPHRPVAIAHAVDLLLRLPPDQRPDGLLIADDNLVPAATQALAAAGVRVPQDLTVVALANYPALPRHAVTVTWLGFDAQRLLNQCVDSLLAAGRGGPVAREGFVPPLFETELAARSVTEPIVSVASCTGVSVGVLFLP